MDSYDVPNVIRVTVGGEQILRLRTSGTGGYDWYTDFEGPADVVEIVASSSTPDPGEPGSAPRSASTDTSLRFRGLRAGVTSVVLEHRRPQEAGGAPLDRRRVEIIVSGGTTTAGA